MRVKVGINGFGRIGRHVLRTMEKDHHAELDLVAINDLVDTKTNAHLLKWDSTYGRYPGDVREGQGSIIVNGREIKVLAEKDPAKIPWKDLGVQIVIESTGLFTHAAKAAAHIQAGARKVLISAPSTGEDLMVVLGVNDHMYDPKKHHILSNASCTTNGIAPLVKVLFENFGLVRGFLTTVHAYTNDQRVLDIAHKDLRRARAAALNIIPTTTGAAIAIGKVIPELKGRFDGISLRVPIPTVSLCDFVATTEKPVTVGAINAAFKAAAEGPLRGILEYTDEELVSSDIRGNPASAVVDGPSTMVLGDNMVKVLSWYDNELGYSTRLADLAAMVATKGI